ncbi:MAG: SIR2 family protein [Ideonella sp.]|nr:SIR2 family protein [Ideonella sp.]
MSSALLTERGAVIHLHGSYTDPSSMVVSLKDYIEHYAALRVQAFLSAMFKSHTVLFVGYGLAELEVLTTSSVPTSRCELGRLSHGTSCCMPIGQPSRSRLGSSNTSFATSVGFVLFRIASTPRAIRK